MGNLELGQLVVLRPGAVRSYGGKSLHDLEKFLEYRGVSMDDTFRVNSIYSEYGVQIRIGLVPVKESELSGFETRVDDVQAVREEPVPVSASELDELKRAGELLGYDMDLLFSMAKVGK